VRLPAGAWLARLRLLILPIGFFAASLPVLEGSQQLELVGGQTHDEDGVEFFASQEQLADVIHWAGLGRRAQLRWLLLNIWYDTFLTDAQERIDEAQRRQPGLAVQLFDGYDELEHEALMLVLDLAAFLASRDVYFSRP
jgi:hypothetical protein